MTDTRLVPRVASDADLDLGRGVDATTATERRATGHPPSLLAAGTSALGAGLIQRKLARRAAARTDGTVVQRKAAAGGRAPKKSATPEEVKAIQRLIDLAIDADSQAEIAEADAEAQKHRGDKGARETGNRAHGLRLKARRFRQEAITLAVAAYGIDIHHAKSVMYGQTIDGGSETDDDGNVTIGDDAFSSPGWLASSIAHEAEVHVGQQNAKGRNYGGNQGRALNEVQAYDWEIGQAKRFGLTKKQVESLRQLRSHYLDRLDRQHREQRQRGDYSLEKGHEED